jgi:hypothetical protein
MTTLTRRLVLTVAGFMLAALQSVASAQETLWTIVYAPATPASTPASIPTLSEWGMLILSVLMVVAAVVSLRKKAGNKTLASVALLSALVLGGFAGDKVIGSANAIILAPVMSNPAGGTIPPFNYDGIELPVTNTSGVAQMIVSITPTVPVSTTSPTCTTNLVVPAGGSCYIATIVLPSSDQRLKREIVYLATLNNGIRIYSFKYLSGDDIHVGVMAQDLLGMPEFKDAVVLGTNGYYTVNYQALGLRMISLSEWNKSSRNIFANYAAGDLAFQKVVALGSP